MDLGTSSYLICLHYILQHRDQGAFEPRPPAYCTTQDAHTFAWHEDVIITNYNDNK